MTQTGAATGAVITYVNGVRQSDAGPDISARDRGLTLADGVFETMRARNGCAFQLDLHLTRLRHGLAALRIRTEQDLARAVGEAVAAFGAMDASVRLTVTRGRGTAGLMPGESSPTVIVTVGAMPAFDERTYVEGLRAHLASGRRNQRAATAGLKTLSYTDAVVGLLEAQSHGADEALFLDTDDHCSEASASNLFFRTGTTLVTPPLTCGALPGVTRATVIELAAGLGLEVAEVVCTLDDLLAAEEAFLTSSLRGIAPLVRVDQRPLGTGRPGPMAQRLASAHAELLERATAGESRR